MGSSPNLWLIGSGSMAQSYAAVLKATGVNFEVIGRGAASAEAFQQATGVPVVCGGLDAAIAKLHPPDQAIVAVGVEQLASVAQRLCKAGFRRLLLEKPGALYLSDLEAVHASARSYGSQVWIAYNRRFYASVAKLRELVLADGGITSAFFEFTEWSHTIKPMQKGLGVKDRWVLANSSHVLDLVFDFIGLPSNTQWHHCHSGSIDWHPSGARFNGAGLTDLGIPFSYQANWEAPGRWGVEIMTQKSRYILRPLEALQVISMGSVKTQSCPLDDDLDVKFKPGIYLQCQAFLKGQTQHLCSISQQLEAFPIYAKIAGYTP